MFGVSFESSRAVYSNISMHFNVRRLANGDCFTWLDVAQVSAGTRPVSNRLSSEPWQSNAKFKV